MDATREAERIGNHIRRARRRAGLTQDELGAFIGADRFAVANLERGVLTTHVRRLLDAIDVVGLEVVVQPRTLGLAKRDVPAESDVGEQGG